MTADEKARGRRPTSAAGRPPAGKPGGNRSAKSADVALARLRPPENAPSSARADGDGDVLFGIHAVAAALANPRRQVRRLLITENAERRLAAEMALAAVTPERASPRDLDRLLGADTVHQGAMAVVDPLPDRELAELIAETGDRGPLVVLDQVTDPHNVGAVLRSAAVFGSAGLVMTRRNSPPAHGILAKSASGALELIDLALVQNLARALGEMTAAGVTVLGLDGAAELMIEDEPLTGPVALVLGAEGKGLRQLTRDSCTRLVRIMAPGQIASLNVSNAAAVALHLAAMRRREATLRG
ncbi:MAG: 23S rRNA (guanosine(2251)-2'-O)-methyltransferase RlmB [Hyphomicrobiaceae bacterium]